MEALSPLPRWCPALLAAALLSSSAPAATSLIEVVRIDGGFRFITQSSPPIYYVLEETPDLENFSPLAIDWGYNAPIWDVLIHPELQPRAFFRIDPVSVFAPRDIDGDRIDDVYEMQNPLILDPLNPNDANLDPDGNGRTHLQEYLDHFGLGQFSVVQAREVSIFNHGTALASFDAVSRELTSFNFGAPGTAIDAVSRQLTAYNGSGIAIAGYPMVVSPEISSYNLGAPSAATEAISRQLSVYQGASPPNLAGYPQVQSLETSVYNAGEPSSPIEAISREVSVNALHPTD